MEKKDMLNLMRSRLRRIEKRKDALKTPGVINRLKSEIKTLEKEIGGEVNE